MRPEADEVIIVRKSLADRLYSESKALSHGTSIPFPSQGIGSGVPIYSSYDAWDASLDIRAGQGARKHIDYVNKLGDLSMNSLVVAAIRWLGNAIQEAPLLVRKKTGGAAGGKGKSEPVENHPMAALWERPNEFYSGATLRKAIAFSHILSANAYVLKNFSEMDDEPVELWWEPHWTIRPVWPIDGSEFISYYEVNRNGSWLKVPVENVIHFRDSLSPYNQRVGFSAIPSILPELFADAEAAAYYAGLMGGSGTPPFMVALDKDMRIDEAGVEAFTRRLIEKTTGSKKGQPIVAKGARAYKLGFNPTELNLSESRYMAEDRFCAVMGIPAVVLELGSGMAHCMPAEVRISTPDRGPVSIAELKAGDEVYSFTEKGIQPRKVLWSGKTGTQQQVYKIKTRNRTILATENHPFLTRRREKVPAPMIGQRRSPEWKCWMEWVCLKDLKVGDRIVEVTSLPDTGKTEAPDGTPVSEQLMQWLGAFVGDGNYWSPDYKEGGAIGMSIPMRDRVGEEYRELTKSLFTSRINNKQHLKSGIGLDPGSNLNTKPVKLTEGINGFGFCSRHTYLWLQSLGFKRGAKNKRIPEWVFALTETLRLAFLRGLLDTDGSVSKRGHACWRMASKDLSRDIRDLAIGLGMSVSNVLYVKQVPSKSGSLAHCFKKESYDSWQVGILSCEDVRRIGSKDLKYVEYLKNCTEKKRISSRYKARGNNLLPEDCEFVPIQKIEPHSIEDVYDITVEDAHNFVAEGVVAHNSIYNNVKQAEERAWTSYVKPFLSQLQNELTVQLLDGWEEPGNGLYCEHDLSKVQALQEDEDAKAKRLEGLYEVGGIMLSELRSGMGYGPSDPDDVDWKKDRVFKTTSTTIFIRPGEQPMSAGTSIIDIETGEVIREIQQAQPPGLGKPQLGSGSVDEEAVPSQALQLVKALLATSNDTNLEWTEFPNQWSDMPKISRNSMPQVKSEHRGAMVQFLKGRGIFSTKEWVLPTILKPSQREYSEEKVDKARNYEGTQRPLLISKDNFVADGHHQWVAALDEPLVKIPVIRLDCDIKDLLLEIARFPSSGVAVMKSLMLTGDIHDQDLSLKSYRQPTDEEWNKAAQWWVPGNNGLGELFNAEIKE